MTRLERAHESEEMDRPDLDPDELADALDDLRRVGSLLGATRAIIREIGLLLPRLGPRPTILDVGTGGGEIPLAIAEMARSRGTEITIIATDVHPQTLDEARIRTEHEPTIHTEYADALDLPFSDDEFDIVFSSTMLHHFDRDHAARVLREKNRVASTAILMTDLRRSIPTLIGAGLLAGTVWRWHPITRHDGPLSARRAYTADELSEIAREAGLRNVSTWSEPMFRLMLKSEKQ